MTTIHTATSADIDALVPLVDGYRQFYHQPSDPEGARRFLERRFARGDARVLIALNTRHAACGFVQLFPLPSTVSLSARWLLNDLFVLPESRCQGVGSALLNAARELAEEHGIPQLMLRTQVENHAAQSRYDALGWQRDDAFHTYLLSV